MTTDFSALSTDCLRHISTFLPSRDVVGFGCTNKHACTTMRESRPAHALFKDAFEHLARTHWLPYCKDKTLVVDVSFTGSLSFMSVCWRNGILSEYYMFEGTKLKKKYRNLLRQDITWHEDISNELDCMVEQVKKKKHKKRQTIYVYFNTLVPHHDHLPRSLVKTSFY